MSCTRRVPQKFWGHLSSLKIFIQLFYNEYTKPLFPELSRNLSHQQVSFLQLFRKELEMLFFVPSAAFVLLTWLSTCFSAIILDLSLPSLCMLYVSLMFTLPNGWCSAYMQLKQLHAAAQRVQNKCYISTPHSIIEVNFRLRFTWRSDRNSRLPALRFISVPCRKALKFHGIEKS